MRKKRLARNTFSSLIHQVTTLACGFILPRLLLKYFGSDVNGLVNSVSQFLQIIAFLDLGVGAVVRSSLYKPLAEKDNIKISQIIVSADKFFKRLAQILLVYVVLLIIVYPYISNQDFGFAYTATLIAAMSISSFAQYYFGVVNRLLLLADQRGYVQHNAQTISLILNTVACAVLIRIGASLQLVKLVTSLIYLTRPLALHLYVKKHYQIDRKIIYTEEPIKQKWNGLAQHVAAIVLDSTDSIVLTIFSTLANVSIYSVYHLVVYGVKQLFTALTSGIQSLMGELWAKQELDELHDFFGWVEWVIHTGTVFLFSCSGMLIVPFVSVYTKGVTDAQYEQPLFAYLLVLANAVHCLRMPYNLMILAGGHYKQTQFNYIIAALLNLVSSILLVMQFGLIGVAIGTLLAMVYQTVWMALYDSKNLLKWSFKNFLKQICVDAISVFFIIAVTNTLKLNILSEITYISWVISSIKTAVATGVIVILVNYIFYKDKEMLLLRKICGQKKRKLAN